MKSKSVTELTPAHNHGRNSYQTLKRAKYEGPNFISDIASTYGFLLVHSHFRWITFFSLVNIIKPNILAGTSIGRNLKGVW